MITQLEKRLTELKQELVFYSTELEPNELYKKDFHTLMINNIQNEIKKIELKLKA